MSLSPHGSTAIVRALRIVQRLVACSAVVLGLFALVPPALAEAQADTSALSRADALRDQLRRQDRVLERWARQLAHPQGVAPAPEEIRGFTESLQRLEAWIDPLADDRAELASKHAALVARAEELLLAASRSRAENADLVQPAESIRWLRLDDDAYVVAGSPAAELAQSSCDAAAEVGVGARAVAGLDGSREALVRFVAPRDGRYLIDTAGSRTDTRLLISDGCSGAELARGDDESGLRAAVQVSARVGDELWIRIGSDRPGFVRLAVETLGTEGGGTATITGTVTTRASGLPIQGLSLRAESAQGFTYFSSTDPSGNYQFTNLPAG